MTSENHLLSHVFVSYVTFLTSPVLCLTSPVPCLTSPVSRLLSPVSHLLSPVHKSCLISPLSVSYVSISCLFHTSCLTSLVLHLMSIVCLTSQSSLMSPFVSCLLYVSRLLSVSCLLSVSRLLSHIYCLSHVSYMSY